MKNNKSLQRKMIGYSAFATSFLLTAKDSDAQIVIYELNDTISSTCGGVLDLNNDGVIDLGAYAGCNIGGGNAVELDGNNLRWIAKTPVEVGYVSSGYLYPLQLSESYLLSAANPWETGGNAQPLGWNPGPQHFKGFWHDGADNKFIGMNFRLDDLDSLYHYCWLRLDVASNRKSAIFYEFACNVISGDPILTGQTAIATSVDELGSSLNIAPNPVLNTIIISGFNIAGMSYEASIYNLQGDLVANFSVAPESPVLRIDVEGLGNGIYLLELKGADVTLKKKFLIQR